MRNQVAKELKRVTSALRKAGDPVPAGQRERWLKKKWNEKPRPQRHALMVEIQHTQQHPEDFLRTTLAGTPFEARVRTPRSKQDAEQ